MADVLVRIDCPECRGELIVAASTLDEPDCRLFCEGCGIAVDFAPAPPQGHSLATEESEIPVRLRRSI